MDRLPNSLCDFCGKPQPKWAFPCQEFYNKTTVHPVKLNIYGFMVSEWAACDTCAALIHVGARRKLAERALTNDEVSHTLSAIFYYDELIEAVMQLQDRFRSNRVAGPPCLIGKARV